jgi:uncharacterized membrane protein
MKKSVEAALYSALLFPGTGHFSLKKYGRGMIFFIPSLAGLFYLVDFTINKASTITEQIIQGNISLDAASISNLMSTPSAGNELLQLHLITWILGIAWALGIVDAYHQGTIADKSNNP